VVGTGIAVAIPDGYAGLVLPRSGLASRHGVSLVNAPGLIDSGYRGELRVPLINHDRGETFRVERGMRIAQLVLVRVADAFFFEGELPQGTDGRGEGGFGSSGA
jgi:dUTP pyrophosphatase